MEERLNAILQAGIQNQQAESGWASVRGRHKKTKDSRPRKIAYKLCLPLHLHCGCRKTQPWLTQNCRLVFIYFVNSIGHPWVTHSLRWFEGVVMDWSLFVFGCWRTEGKQVWKWIGLCKVDTIKECPDQTCLHRWHTDDLPPYSHFFMSGLYDSCDVSHLAEDTTKHTSGFLITWSRSFPIEVTLHIITLYYYIFSQPCKLEQCLCRCQSHVHIQQHTNRKNDITLFKVAERLPF